MHFLVLPFGRVRSGPVDDAAYNDILLHGLVHDQIGRRTLDVEDFPAAMNMNPSNSVAAFSHYEEIRRVAKWDRRCA